MIHKSESYSVSVSDRIRARLYHILHIPHSSTSSCNECSDVEHVVSLFAVRWRWRWLNEYTSNEARKKREEGER